MIEKEFKELLMPIMRKHYKSQGKKWCIFMDNEIWLDPVAHKELQSMVAARQPIIKEAFWLNELTGEVEKVKEKS